MEKIIDLHIHTTYSDGVLTPKEVIDEASLNGVSIISIVDHDTIQAYNEELFSYAKNKNIEIIPAVEISTKINKCGIHVLGYNIDIYSQDLIQKLEALRNARHDYLHNVHAKLQKLGYILNVEELSKIDSVTKAHIARDIIQNRSNEELLIKNFGYVPNMGEFIETIMNEGCPAYVKKETITPKEAAELIRKAGGKVILAHPVAYTYEDDLKTEDILKLVREMNADGIEAYYIYIDRNNVKHNDIQKWVEFANLNNLKVTVGSDFHNKDGIRPLIGLVNENIDIDSKIIDDIITFLFK